jgi:hypothetical protein
MIKTMRILSMASLLMMGAATAMAANDGGGGVGSKGVTGTELGSQQTNIPATGSALAACRTQRPCAIFVAAARSMRNVWSSLGAGAT